MYMMCLASLGRSPHADEVKIGDFGLSKMADNSLMSADRCFIANSNVGPTWTEALKGSSI